MNSGNRNLVRAVGFSILAASLASAATAQSVGGVKPPPVALMCTLGDKTFVGYLSEIGKDGSTVYVAAAGPIATVDSSGLVGRGTSGAKGNCDGRTIDELRESHQTLEWPDN